MSAVPTSSAAADPTEKRAPSLTEVLAIALCSGFIFLIVLRLLGGSYWYLVNGNFGDNLAYIQAANAIRHWHHFSHCVATVGAWLRFWPRWQPSFGHSEFSL